MKLLHVAAILLAVNISRSVWAGRHYDDDHHHQHHNHNADFKQFVAEIEAAINDSATYVLPTNNDAYFTPEDDSGPVDYGTYDFIIIGGGTAGGVLANRLTEEDYTVLVVEAGKQAPILSSILGLLGYLYYSECNWGYFTTSQTQACLGVIDQKCFYPRGKAIGGSSMINGGFYIRGNRKDYDNWEALGNTGWSYDDVLPYFKKSETAKFTVDIDEAYHGFSGPQKIDIPNDTPNMTERFLKAFLEFNKTESDYNGENQYGASRMQFFLDYNIRASTAQAFINPILHRTNLFITAESLVTKILISSDAAYGIEFVKNGTTYYANASKEVIVSAGSINSPQVLMLSGIGPSSHLTELGIDVIADLPVGQNLLDHLYYTGLYYRTSDVYYNNTLWENLKLWEEAERPLTAAVDAQIISFWNYDGDENSQPDVEIFTLSASSSLAQSYQFIDEYVESFKVIDSLTDILLGIALLHPQSVGSVTLQSRDPRDYPLINPNYLTEEADIETLYKGIRTALSFNNTESFQNWGIQFYSVALPSCEEYEIMSKDWWYCGLRTLSVTAFHPVGTTRMGNNTNDSVVDSNLKVHGIDNLRVVDAGVLPTHISGHTNAVTVMIAEKIADVIKADYAT